MADALVSAVIGHTVVGCDPYGAPQYAPATAAQEAAAETSRAATTPNAAAETAAEVDAQPTNHAGSAADDSSADDSTVVVPDIAPTAAMSGKAVALSDRADGCGINISLIMTDRTLLDGDDEPAQMLGFGPIPAALARALVVGAADTTTRTWIRRLFADPLSGELTAMDSKRRLFPAAAQRFLLARDQTCRTP